MPGEAVISELLKKVIMQAGLWGEDQEIQFPIITRKARNEEGNIIHFYFNYSAGKQSFVYQYKDGYELLSDLVINKSQELVLEPWGFFIIEESQLCL